MNSSRLKIKANVCGVAKGRWQPVFCQKWNTVLNFGGSAANQDRLLNVKEPLLITTTTTATLTTAIALASPSSRIPSTSPSPPQTLEELDAILAKGRDHVDEDLWRLAIKMELEYLRYTNDKVPTMVTPEMMERAYKEKSHWSRRGLYRLFWKKELFKAKKMANQEEIRRLKEEKKKHTVEWEPSMTIMTRVDESAAKRHQQTHLEFGRQFGQPLVIDLGLDYVMRQAEVSSFVSQMKSVYSQNRAQWEPFSLHLCNYDHNKPGMRELIENKDCLDWRWDVTSSCFSSMFPLERLVYLCPDAPEVATEWRHDDIYVVGGVVDREKGGGGQITLSKTKRLGIRSQKLDVDKYFKKKKSPLLTLDVMFACLVDARDSNGNWAYSLRHIPKRCIQYRPQYSFMETFPTIHSDSRSRVLRSERSIFKPQNTTT